MPHPTALPPATARPESAQTGRMQRQHQLVLSKNYEFLVMEMPMDATLEAIGKRRILTWHDQEQLKTLRHQGRRALARYLLAVLPVRGPRAFQALLESLQEANAQHLVDLLVAQAGADNSGKPLPNGEQGGKPEDEGAPQPPQTPSDTPLPAGPDPHEYAVRLSRNNKLIREFVDPSSISPVLAQNKVITAREADMVLHLHGKNKKWDLILAAVLQRGERAYQAFLAALLQKGYSTMFHTIQETDIAYSGSDPDVAHNDDDESDEEVIQEARNSIKSQQYIDTMDLNPMPMPNPIPNPNYGPPSHPNFGPPTESPIQVDGSVQPGYGDGQSLTGESEQWDEESEDLGMYFTPE